MNILKRYKCTKMSLCPGSNRLLLFKKLFNISDYQILKRELNYWKLFANNDKQNKINYYNLFIFNKRSLLTFFPFFSILLLLSIIITIILFTILNYGKIYYRNLQDSQIDRKKSKIIEKVLLKMINDERER